MNAPEEHETMATEEPRKMATEEHRTVATEKHRKMTTDEHRKRATDEHRRTLRWMPRTTAFACVVLGWSVGLLSWLTAVVAAQTNTVANTPQVRASVDRTAVWVGDRVRFTIEIDCPPNVDVLDDDLSRGKLKLEGFEIAGSESGRIDRGNGAVTRRFVYDLTTFRVDAPSLRVAPFSARYYVRRPGQRLDDAAPAGEVQVPGVTVALRSTLPDAPDYPLRDAKTAVPRGRMYALAQPVGIALIVVSFAPVAFWAIALVDRRRRRVTVRSPRKARSDERLSLQAVRELDLTSEASRREACTRIETVVREHVRDVWGVPGPSLVPAEIAPALSARGGRIDPQRVAALLAACERARYAPAPPSAEACRDALSEAEQLIEARR